MDLDVAGRRDDRSATAATRSGGVPLPAPIAGTKTKPSLRHRDDGDTIPLNRITEHHRRLDVCSDPIGEAGDLRFPSEHNRLTLVRL